MGHLGTSDFTMTHSSNKERSSAILPSLWVKKIEYFLLNSDLANERTYITQGWITEMHANNCPQIASAQTYLQRKHNPFLTFEVGRTLVYTLEIYHKDAKWQNDMFALCIIITKVRNLARTYEKSIEYEHYGTGANRAVRHLCLNWKAASPTGKSEAKVDGSRFISGGTIWFIHSTSIDFLFWFGNFILFFN